MSEIRSEPGSSTTIDEYVGIGDEVIVYPGVHLAGDVSVYPRLKVPSAIHVPRGAELTGPADVLRYL